MRIVAREAPLHVAVQLEAVVLRAVAHGSTCLGDRRFAPVDFGMLVPPIGGQTLDRLSE
jgi:hypothetical protein